MRGGPTTAQESKAYRIYRRVMTVGIGALFFAGALMCGIRGRILEGGHGHTTGIITAADQPIPFWGIVILMGLAGLLLIVLGLMRDEKDV